MNVESFQARPLAHVEMHAFLLVRKEEDFAGKFTEKFSNKSLAQKQKNLKLIER